MTKRMLIDATHAEETRVVVLDGNRLEDFDVETSTKRQLKGNIYLAKVVRVEPSLQAAFVEYGGNRHGFLAFSEIHPDYYQIPVADRQRLIEQEAEEARREEEEVDRELDAGPAAWTQPEPPAEPETAPADAREFAAEPATRVAGAAADVLDDRALEQGQVEPVPSAVAESGDSITAALADDSAFPAPGPTGERGDHVTGAVSVAPIDSAAEPADVLPAPAETAAPAVPPAGIQPEAEPPPDATSAVVQEPPADASPAEASQAEDGAISAPEHNGAEHGASEPDASGHSDEPEAPARRAQPLIIEQETLTGPVETGHVDDESDAFTQTVEADTEHDPDLGDDEADPIPESPPPETVGGEPDAADEQRERRLPSRYLRNYKIQEVIRRRQILLVQVVKEERGTKGAALTTYISLAGRFCVLMPNSPRGGGISRKITSATDRRRLKEVVAELEIPRGMGLIVRTAGANRPKPEIKRDCEYLLRLWDDIREHTLKSVAPAQIYEEASLIKRAIRDVYSRDIDEIQVDGEDGWRAAHEFMRMLMPSHAKKVQLWRDPSQPLFAKYQVEAQLDGMLQPTVQLRSGGYLVINQTEALVAIDVNSGRSTRERNVEETAVRTNLEAADEVARQLRLRDLAGLIVIDFIDMEAKKHNAMVERRIKEALKNDRARIQVGHISHFGLLEMSRQRLRPSLTETSFILCPHCGGTGHVRSTENAAIHVLRGIEEEGSKRRAAEIVVHTATPIALYILNHKRERLGEIERRYAMRVTVQGDDTQVASQFRIDRVRPQVAREEVPAAITPDAPQPALPAPRFEPEDEVIGEEDTDLDETAEAGVDEFDADDAGAEDGGPEDTGGDAGGEGSRTDGAEGSAEQGDRRRRRRRRRRGGRREETAPFAPAEAAADADAPPAQPAPVAEQAWGEPGLAAADENLAPADSHIEGVPEHAEAAGDDDARRRRGRRGGRRRRREPGDAEGSQFAALGAEQPDLPPVYAGPTPANPFGGQVFDIFDVLEQVEANVPVRQEPAEPNVQQLQRETAAMTGLPAVENPSAAEGYSEAAPTEPRAPGVAAPDGWEPPYETAAMTGLPKAENPPATESYLEAAPGQPRVPDATTEPVAAPEGEAASAELDIVNASAPEPSPGESVGEAAQEVEPASAEAPAQVASMPGEAPIEVANDVAPEPAIRPIIVGSGEEPAEKKRGWWRR
jgi:ribonuclease E